MAVGVGFAGDDVAGGVALGLGIALQNVPEGLAVAVSLLAIGYRKWTAFWVACLIGLAEPVGGTIGAAAGAVLLIISHEIIPAIQHGPKNLGTFSLLAGIALMLFVQVTLA